MIISILILIFIKAMLFINITNIEHNTMVIFLFTSLVSLLVLSGIEMLGKKYRKPVKMIFYAFVSIVMFIDVMYYSYFTRLPSIDLLGQMTSLGVISDTLLNLLSLKNLLFIIDLPLVGYLIWKKDHVWKFPKKTLKWISIASIASVFLIATTMANAEKASVLTNQEFYSYHTSDIVEKYFKSDAEGVEEAKEVLEIMETDKTEMDPNAKHFGIGKGRNLIVVQLESIQDFLIGLEYNGEEVTPNLNKFIGDESSLYFDEYYQLIGRGNTSDAEFITNNSLHPSSEEPTYHQYGKNTFYGLPWLLRDNGYNAWVFHGFEKTFWNRSKAYPNQGFQRFLSEEDFDYEEKIIFGISDREFYEQSLDYLKEMDEIDENPFYSLLISLSCHTPYNIDEKYHVLDIREPQKDTIVGDYLQAAHYADQEFGKFLEGLKQEGLYDNSVIAVYGDHYGISNGDEEVFEPMEDILGEPYNYDHIMNIPLIINVPGEEIGETVSKIGSQIDFYPTIINILGLENEKGYMMGMDLLNSEKYNYVSPQRVMRRGSFIDKDVIFNISSDGIFENSQVEERSTRRSLPVENYRDVYNHVIDYIGISDTILQNDLFKYLLDEDADIEELGQVGEKIQSQKRVKSLEKFKIGDLSKLYNRREKLIRIYIDEGTDLDQLENWMETHQDAKLILHSKEEGTELLENIKDEYEELKGRYIAEIDDFNDYFAVQRKGFKNIILDIRGKSYKEGEIEDFLNLYSHFGLITGKDSISKEFESKVKEKGIRVYVERFNRLIEK